MRLIYILIISFFLFSCTSNKTEKEIYDVVLNSIVQPIALLPPPEFGNDSNVISKAVKDSLYNVSLNVAVSSKMIGFKFKNEELSFTDKVNKGEIEYYVSNKILASELLFGRNSLSFEIISEEDLKDIFIYDNYNGLLKISNIQYNNNNNKALVVVSYSMGKLSGNTVLFYLEKKPESWIILKSRSLSVS